MTEVDLFRTYNAGYYDYFENIKMCMRSMMIDIRKDPVMNRVALFLTVTSMMVGGRPVRYQVKYCEALEFAENYVSEASLCRLESTLAGTLVLKAFNLLNGTAMTPDEFAAYDRVLSHFFPYDISFMNKLEQKFIRERYTLSKKKLESLYFTEHYSEEEKKEEKKKEEKKNSPHGIAEYLRGYVVGQDEAVDMMANVVFQFMYYRNHGITPPKSYNVILVGDSGTGKTTMIHALSKLVPVREKDSTGYSETGYIGKDPKDLVDCIGRGEIVFFDEFDKILMPSYDKSGRNCHLEIQGCFFKAMEDARGMNIFAGAFEGIDAIVERRLKKANHFMGFNSDFEESEEPLEITQEDLVAFGATREFMGRIDVIIRMRKLTQEDFVKILRESKCSPVLAEVQIAKDCYGIDLELTDSFYSELAEIAIRNPVGARAIKQHLTRTVDPILAQALSLGMKKVTLRGLEEEPELHGVFRA